MHRAKLLPWPSLTWVASGGSLDQETSIMGDF